MTGRKRKQLLLAALVGIPGLAVSQVARATAYTWTGADGASPGLWQDSGNWSSSGGTFPSAFGDGATFSLATPAMPSISLGGSTVSLSTLSFSGSAPTYTIGTTSGDTLNFATSGASITLANGTTTQVINAAITTNGPLALTNSNPNTGTNVLVLNGFMSGTNQISLNGGGAIGIGSSSTASGGALGLGTVVINAADAGMQAVGGNQTVSNPISIANGGPRITENTTSPGDLTWSGPVTSNITQGRTFSVNTPGHSFNLGAAGAGASTFTLNGNGAFNLAFAVFPGATLVQNDVIVDGTNSAGAKLNTISYNTPSGQSAFGTVVLNAPSTYAGSTTFSEAGGVFQLGVSSTMSGTVVTSGAFGVGTVIPSNSSSPATFEPHGGDRVLGNAISLANGGFIVANDASGSYNLTLAGPVSLTGSGRVVNNNMNAGTSLTFGQASAPSTITLGNGTAAVNLQFQSNGGSTASTVINDVIQDSSGGGAGGVVIQGGGPVYLNASNTYTGGTTVRGAGSSASAVGTGGTLAGTGTVGGGGVVAVSSTNSGSFGGVISPGRATLTAGTISVPSMQWNPYGRYVFEHNGTSATVGGGVNDLISGGGTLDLSNLSAATPFDLNLQPLTSGNGSPETYTIASFTGGILSGGASLAGTDVTGDFTFSGNFGGTPDVTVSGDDQRLLLTFTPAATPEPSTVLLIGAALGALGVRSRRRNRGEKRGA